MNNHSLLLKAFGISESELEDFRENNIGLFRLDKKRVSTLLMVQLASASKVRSFNTFSVTDVVGYLEGLRLTKLVKDPEQFKHPPLNCFWKVHFTDPVFFGRNLANEMGIFSIKSNKVRPLCKKVLEQEKRDPSPVGWQGRLAHALTIEAYEARAARKEMTGEWIIFGKYENQNYYLCIAQHSGSKETDQEIFNAIKRNCEQEFPFLFNNAA